MWKTHFSDEMTPNRFTGKVAKVAFPGFPMEIQILTMVEALIFNDMSWNWTFLLLALPFQARAILT